MDKMRKTSNVLPTTLSASIDDTTTTIPLTSTVGVYTDGYIDIVIDRVDDAGNKTPDKMEVITVLIVGNNGTNAVRGRTSPAQPHDNGAVVEYNISTSSMQNDGVDGFLEQHNADGTHEDITAESLTVAGAVALTSKPPEYYRFTGEMALSALRFAPAGWLLCDGAAVSRSTYAALFDALNPSLGTITVTIASPGLVTLTGHGLLTGDGIYLTSTGSLPTGISQNTQYWVIKNDANSFWLATTPANAAAGTKINTTGSQTGTHTLRLCPYGVGNGTTTFNVPDMRGRVPVGIDPSDSDFNTLGKSGGQKTVQQHDHLVRTGAGSAGVIEWSRPSGATGRAYPMPSGTSVNTSAGFTDTTGAGINNMNPYRAVSMIIKL